MVSDHRYNVGPDVRWWTGASQTPSAVSSRRKLRGRSENSKQNDVFTLSFSADSGQLQRRSKADQFLSVFTFSIRGPER